MEGSTNIGRHGNRSEENDNNMSTGSQMKGEGSMCNPYSNSEMEDEGDEFNINLRPLCDFRIS